VAVIDLLGGGILGSLVGGLFRLAPEAMKWMDKGNERKHELAMFKQQVELEQHRGSQKLAEIGAASAAAVDQGVVDAFKLVIDQQTEMVKSAGGWAASVSASVRPVVTYWIFLIWAGIQLFLAVKAGLDGMPAAEAAKMLLTPDFLALVSGTLNYWFLDRTLQKRGL
jgi:hypothetical protein